MRRRKSCMIQPCSKKHWLLVILVLQNSLSALVGRFTLKAAPEDRYVINHFVLVAEVGKLLTSLLLEAWKEQNLLSILTYLWGHPRESFKMAIPAVLYWGSNTLLYVALSKLTVPIFQVAYQGKLVITALVSVCALGRTYDVRQWFCLVVISLGIAFIALEDTTRYNMTREINETTMIAAANRMLSPDISGNMFTGLGAIAIASLLSAISGVYFEYVVKTDRTDVKTPSLWMRNIQLAFFSIIVALAQLKLNEDSGGNKTKTFFHGFTYVVWCQLILFAAGGLLVAAVVQHTDNVVKGLACAISVLISSAGSIVLYNSLLTPIFSISAVITVTAVYMFFGESTSRLLTYRPFILSLSLIFPFWISQLITPPQLNSRLPRNEVLERTEMVTNIFPTNWNSSTTALDALRLIQNQVAERHFHEGTHILYDLRTAIGNRPAKYLEIGSYTGISAALMLRHPFPTFATLVDPCVLDSSHFRGSLSQEETIRKNLAALTVNNVCRDSFRPWDLRVGFSPHALPKGETFDIIFIDGDHSTQGVWADYAGTVELLRPGGFMVFDDYLDQQHSPQVRPAVDDIVRSTDLIAIGTPRNIHGIHIDANRSYINEYIFQRRGEFKFLPQLETDVASSQPMLGIAVATYRRHGMTVKMLENLWTMLLSQSYTNWKLYLTGDLFDNETEWESLSFFDHSKASLYNLPEAGERGKLQGEDLWLHGGTAAVNDAIDRSVADGIPWAVHLDDDDTWDTDHLENVVAGILTGATFVFVQCQYGSTWLPGDLGLTNISHTVFPKPCNVIHSSVAFNAVKLTSRYKITSGFPADADLWSRIVYDDNFYPAYVPIKSCHHLSERGSGLIESILRRWDLLDRDPPPGWYKNASRYTTLASEIFPVNLSEDCKIIIGPRMNPPVEYTDQFAQLSIEKVPYHVRVVETLAGLPVWQKL